MLQAVSEVNSVRLPNFIIVGAPKCGTTSLCEYLGGHPDVFMSVPKEPHYFGAGQPALSLDRYRSLFAAAKDEVAIGEGSTSYTKPGTGDNAARHIYQLISDCRIIYIVRHPLHRIESDWRMRQREGWRSSSVSDAVEIALSNEHVRLSSKSENPELWWKQLLLTQGLYQRNLYEYVRLFPREQILVVFLEDLANSPEVELARCFRHIGVDPRAGSIQANVLNSSTKARRYSPLAKVITRSSVASRFKSLAPGWLRSLARATLTTQESFPIQWKPRILGEVRRYYEADSREFLASWGKPPDFWTW